MNLVDIMSKVYIGILFKQKDILLIGLESIYILLHKLRSVFGLADKCGSYIWYWTHVFDGCIGCSWALFLI